MKTCNTAPDIYTKVLNKYSPQMCYVLPKGSKPKEPLCTGGTGNMT